MFTNTDDIEIMDYQFAGLKKVKADVLSTRKAYKTATKRIPNYAWFLCGMRLHRSPLFFWRSKRISLKIFDRQRDKVYIPGKFSEPQPWHG